MPDARRSRFRHDPEVIAALHVRYTAGEDPGSLAAELGISRNALLCQFHHKGLGGRVSHHWWTQKEIKHAAERHSKGESLAKIAASLGVAEDRLYRALLAADVGYSEREQHDRQTKTYFENTRMYNMRRQGSSHAEIAAAMGWDAGPAGRRRVANRIIKYCERIGISIPVADVIQRVDGTRRRVGYSKEIVESMERRIQRARTRRPKGKRG